MKRISVDVLEQVFEGSIGVEKIGIVTSVLDFVGVELRKLSNCSPSQVGHQDVEHLSYRSEGLGERLLVVNVVLW